MKSRPLILAVILILATACTENDSPPPDCGPMPQGNRTISVRIISVNPNPAGSDDYKESFTIKNFGSEPVNLAGWKVVHSGESQWDLAAVKELKPCHQVTVFNLNKESLLNGRDYLKLVNNNNIQVQSVEWDSAAEGKEIVPR